jgi:hypothetical protein
MLVPSFTLIDTIPDTKAVVIISYGASPIFFVAVD